MQFSTTAIPKRRPTTDPQLNDVGTIRPTRNRCIRNGVNWFLKILRSGKKNLRSNLTQREGSRSRWGCRSRFWRRSSLIRFLHEIRVPAHVNLASPLTSATGARRPSISLESDDRGVWLRCLPRIRRPELVDSATSSNPRTGSDFSLDFGDLSVWIGPLTMLFIKHRRALAGRHSVVHTGGQPCRR